MQSPAPGEKQHQVPVHTGSHQLESNLAEKVLGALVNTKLNMIQQCALADKKADRRFSESGILRCPGKEEKRLITTS